MTYCLNIRVKSSNQSIRYLILKRQKLIFSTNMSKNVPKASDFYRTVAAQTRRFRLSRIDLTEKLNKQMKIRGDLKTLSTCQKNSFNNSKTRKDLLKTSYNWLKRIKTNSCINYKNSTANTAFKPKIQSKNMRMS